MPFTLNGNRLLALTLDFPRVGLWMADAQIESDTPPSVGPAVLEVDGQFLNGFVVASGEVGGIITCRLVAGGGGFGTTVQGRFLNHVPVRTALGYLLLDANEEIASGVDPAILDRVLAVWTTRATTFGAAFATLLGVLEVSSWRVLDDGRLWFGAESWPVFSPEGFVTLTAEDPVSRVRTYGVEDLRIRPGVVFAGQRVSHVTIRLASGSYEAEVWTEPPDGDPTASRLLRGLLGVIRKEIDSRVDYLARYEAKVEETTRETRDGVERTCVSLTPADPRLPPMTRVEVRGLAGTRQTIKRGTRCLLGWANGDPSAPYASDFDQSGLESIEVSADASVSVQAPEITLGADAIAVALLGAMIVGSTAPAFVWVPTPAGLIVASPVIAVPDGGPPKPPTEIPSAGDALGIAVTGQVINGSSVVKAGV